jgi:hypothetical protein
VFERVWTETDNDVTVMTLSVAKAAGPRAALGGFAVLPFLLFFVPFCVFCAFFCCFLPFCPFAFLPFWEGYILPPTGWLAWKKMANDRCVCSRLLDTRVASVLDALGGRGAQLLYLRPPDGSSSRGQ